MSCGFIKVNCPKKKRWNYANASQTFLEWTGWQVQSDMKNQILIRSKNEEQIPRRICSFVSKYFFFNIH